MTMERAITNIMPLRGFAPNLASQRGNNREHDQWSYLTLWACTIKTKKKHPMSQPKSVRFAARLGTAARLALAFSTRALLRWAFWRGCRFPAVFTKNKEHRYHNENALKPSFTNPVDNVNLYVWQHRQTSQQRYMRRLISVWHSSLQKNRLFPPPPKKKYSVGKRNKMVRGIFKQDIWITA